MSGLDIHDKIHGGNQRVGIPCDGRANEQMHACKYTDKVGVAESLTDICRGAQRFMTHGEGHLDSLIIVSHCRPLPLLQIDLV